RNLLDRVEHRVPRFTGARGLPDAARRKSGVKSAALTDNAGDRGDPAAAERADVSPDESGEEIGPDGRGAADREKCSDAENGGCGRSRSGEVGRHGRRL